MERASGINLKVLKLSAPESLNGFVIEIIEVYFVSRCLVTEKHINPSIQCN